MTFAHDKGLGIVQTTPHSTNFYRSQWVYIKSKAMVVEICFNREDNVPEHDASTSSLRTQWGHRSMKAWISAARVRTFPLLQHPSLLASRSLSNLIFISIAHCWRLSVHSLTWYQLANDYYDFIKGVDNDNRVKPHARDTIREISPKAMRRICIDICIAHSDYWCSGFPSWLEIWILGIASVSLAFCILEVQNRSAIWD